MYAQHLVDKKKFDEAISVLAQYLLNAGSTNSPAYIA
jgi:uncharacterized protein YqgQ